MITKENLFKLIREEEVIIWAGAGISMNAGYPSGNKLSEIIYGNLSEAEKNAINKNLNLPDLTEEIFRIKNGNRNFLIKNLKSIFDKVHESSESHSLISKIPHFKTIITTNYDKLFELSYQENCNVIYDENNIPYITKDKTQIFKVHGDLSQPNSIIITKTDYNNFFKLDSESNTFWTVVKERLSTNVVLFLGYNLEDPNISVIFDRISDSLKENRKECFLISPNLPAHKVTDLLRKNISYIDATAEEFLNELITNLKNNIVNDLEEGKVSADTLKKFLQNFNLLPSLESSEKSYNVTSIRGADGSNVEGKLNFTIENDKTLIEKIKSFTQGNEFGELEIDESVLKNVDLYYGGIRLSRSDKFVKLKFHSTPTFNTKVDIRYENGYEYEDFPVKMYGNEKLIEIHSEFKEAKLIFKINFSKNPPNFKFNYKLNDYFDTTNSGLKLFNFLKNFSSGEKFTIFINKENKITQKFERFSDFNEDMRFLIEYFEKLQIIEKHFNVKFKNFDRNDVNDENFRLISNITDIIKDGFIIMDFDDEIIFELIENFSEESLKLIKEIGKNNFPIVANQQIEEIKEIHGVKINLGFKQLQYLDPIVVNLEEISSRKVNKFRVKSSTNQCRLTYNKTNEN